MMPSCTWAPSNPRAFRSRNTISQAVSLSLSPRTMANTLLKPPSSTPSTTSVGSLATVVRRTEKKVPST